MNKYTSSVPISVSKVVSLVTLSSKSTRFHLLGTISYYLLLWCNIWHQHLHGWKSKWVATKPWSIKVTKDCMRLYGSPWQITIALDGVGGKSYIICWGGGRGPRCVIRWLKQCCFCGVLIMMWHLCLMCSLWASVDMAYPINLPPNFVSINTVLKELSGYFSFNWE